MLTRCTPQLHIVQELQLTIEPKRSDQLRVVRIIPSIRSVWVGRVVVIKLFHLEISFILSSTPAIAREPLLARQAAVLTTQAADTVLTLAANEGS